MTTRDPRRLAGRREPRVGLARISHKSSAAADMPATASLFSLALLDIRWVTLVVLALLPLWVAAQDPPATAEPSVLEIPLPNLEALEPAAREKLLKNREAFAEGYANLTTDSQRAAAFGDLGRGYYFYELFAVAEPCFRNAVQLEPREFRWRYFLGVLLQDLGRFEEAREYLEGALASRPDDAPTQLRLGEILLHLQQDAAAESHFHRVATLDPTNAAAVFGLGRIHQRRGEWELALAAFRRTLELQPDAASVYHPLAMTLRRLGQLDAAKEALRHAGTSQVDFADPLRAELFRDSASARALLVEGNRARRRGLIDLAIANYRSALEIDPNESLVHYNLGTTLIGRGDLMGAEHHFRAAIAAKDDYRDAWFNLALCLRDQRRFPEALETFEKLLAKSPADAPAALERAITLDLLGRREDSLAALGAIAVWPELPAGDRAILASYFEQLGRIAEAEAVLRQGLVAAPNAVELHLGLARLLGRLGRYAEAADRFDRVLSLDPDHLDARLGRTIALGLTQRCEEARRELEAAAARRPDLTPLRDALRQLGRLCPPN